MTATPQRYDAVKVTPNSLYVSMLSSSVRQGKASAQLINNYHQVALDPGETTGAASSVVGQDHFNLTQLRTPTVEEGIDVLEEYLRPFFSWPTLITIEDYRVYSWKADDHKWAGLHTPQLIGALRYLVHRHPYLTLHLRLAQQAKGFATDANLEKWGVYEKGMKHARDAERHLITSMFFGADIKDFKGK